MDLTPTDWQLWIIAALGFGVLEMKTSGFVTLWFAIGSLVAALVAGLGLGINFQLMLFTMVSVALFAASRTIFKEAEAFPPLNYEKGGGSIDLAFWRAPERLFDEPDEFLAWARAAMGAARRVAAKRDKATPKRKSIACWKKRTRTRTRLSRSTRKTRRS